LTTMSNNQMPNKALMKNVMRGIAVVMIPMTLDMPQAVFMYWSANSSFSVVQMLTLKNKALKKWLDIPDPPPEDPSIIDKPRSNPLQGLMEAAKKAAEERKAQQAGTPSFIPTPLVSAKAKESPEAAKKEAEKPKAIEAPAELPKGPTFAVHPRFKKKSS
jgi:membrane protein insertase Oxa1/YidC/SpoIIIJ